MHPFKEKKILTYHNMLPSRMGVGKPLHYICLHIHFQWSINELWNTTVFPKNSLLYVKPCKHLSKQNMLFEMTFFFFSKINNDFVMRQNLQRCLPNIATVSLRLLHGIVQKLSLHPSRFVFYRLLQAVQVSLLFIV